MLQQKKQVNFLKEFAISPGKYRHDRQIIES